MKFAFVCWGLTAFIPTGLEAQLTNKLTSKPTKRPTYETCNTPTLSSSFSGFSPTTYGFLAGRRLLRKLLQCPPTPPPPTKYPTKQPTQTPSWNPTWSPTDYPTAYPTPIPTTRRQAEGLDTFAPSPLPTPKPTRSPTSPTYVPTQTPTEDPEALQAFDNDTTQLEETAIFDKMIEAYAVSAWIFLTLFPVSCAQLAHNFWYFSPKGAKFYSLPRSYRSFSFTASVLLPALFVVNALKNHFQANPEADDYYTRVGATVSLDYLFTIALFALLVQAWARLINESYSRAPPLLLQPKPLAVTVAVLYVADAVLIATWVGHLRSWDPSAYRTIMSIYLGVRMAVFFVGSFSLAFYGRLLYRALTHNQMKSRLSRLVFCYTLCFGSGCFVTACVNLVLQTAYIQNSPLWREHGANLALVLGIVQAFCCVVVLVLVNGMLRRRIKEHSKKVSSQGSGGYTTNSGWSKSQSRKRQPRNIQVSPRSAVPMSDLTVTEMTSEL